MTTDPQNIAFLGEPRLIPLSALRLDDQNPRLPEERQGGDQEDLAVTLALGFDAYTVAESIASHGYFNSEPLIVIPSDTEPGAFVVIEGNRRLTALLGLSRQNLRSAFADADRWEQLASHTGITGDSTIPVVVAADRRQVVPIVGFRHISGILQWQPYAQARYIAKLVDDDHMTFNEVATMVGIDRTRVGNLYRDQAMAGQAKALGIETGNLERSFSLLTAAMNIAKLRGHVSAPVSSQMKPGQSPVPPARTTELKELLGWVFGDGQTPPVISDSRELSKLGNVIANDVGVQSLRKGETLEQANQRISDNKQDPRTRLILRLRTGRNSLQNAAEVLDGFEDDLEVKGLIAEARAAIDGLQDATAGD